jgi:hypothetical protein
MSNIFTAVRIGTRLDNGEHHSFYSILGLSSSPKFKTLHSANAYIDKQLTKEKDGLTQRNLDNAVSKSPLRKGNLLTNENALTNES